MLDPPANKMAARPADKSDTSEGDRQVTEKYGAGQADKRAADERTAQAAAANPKSTDSAAAENAANAREAQESREAYAKVTDPSQSGDPSLAKAGEGAGADSAAERVGASQDSMSGMSAEVLDPFPAYEVKSLDELRALAESRGVEMNRDAEKAFLVHGLRAQNPSPEYDLMTLEVLRERAQEEGVEVPVEHEVAHLVSELRSADTHAGTGGR